MGQPATSTVDTGFNVSIVLLSQTLGVNWFHGLTAGEESRSKLCVVRYPN